MPLQCLSNFCYYFRVLGAIGVHSLKTVGMSVQVVYVLTAMVLMGPLLHCCSSYFSPTSLANLSEKVRGDLVAAFTAYPGFFSILVFTMNFLIQILDRNVFF